MGRIGNSDRLSPVGTLVHTLDRAISAQRWAPTLRLLLVACVLGLPPLGALVVIVMTLGPYLGAIIGAAAGAGLLTARRRNRRLSGGSAVS